MTKINKLIPSLLAQAQKLGADEAEACFFQMEGFSLSVRLGELDVLSHNQDQELIISVYCNGSLGSASTTDLSKEALQLMVAKAVQIAKFTERDPCNGLAPKELMAHDYPNLDLYHPWQLDPNAALLLAKEYEAQGLGYDKRIVNSEGVTINTHTYNHEYANTHGFHGSYQTSCHEIACSLIAGYNSEQQVASEYTVARDAKDLLAGQIVAKGAAQKAIERLGARSLTTRTCPVIFHAEVARGLLGAFVAAISGGNLYRNTSFLLDHLGKQVFPDFITLNERPHLRKAMGSVPFDDEGMMVKPKTIVAGGVLESYLLDSYSARKLNMQPTGNAGGVHNLVVNTQELDLTSLLGQMDQGLLVTELMGQGVNLVTGDYSRGAVGFWVENGKIQYPVNEITIAGNLKEMFLHLVAVAGDVDRRGSIHTGSVLMDEMTIAGATRRFKI